MEKIIRSVERPDAPAIRDIYAPFVSESATSFEIEPPDAAAMERRILDQREQFPWLVYEAGGEVLGYAYAGPHRAARKAYQWCVEVSIYVHAQARRRGIGRALYASLFDLLRRQGYVNAYAGITLPNPGSLRLHESMGFVPIGVYPRIGFKFGKWHDVIWLQLRLQEAEVPVAEPRPAKGLFEDLGVRTLLRGYALRGGGR
jgi:phosphinothricin acetyltransferase